MVDEIGNILSIINFRQTQDWSIKHFFTTTPIVTFFELKPIGKSIHRVKDSMNVQPNDMYKRLTIKINNGGVLVRDTELGSNIKTKKQYFIKAGQLAVSKIDARNGAFGIVPPEADNSIITGNFWVYTVDEKQADIQYLVLIFSSSWFVQAWQDCSNGSGNRLYLQENKFLNFKIPFPPLEKQKLLVKKYKDTLAETERCEKEVERLEASIEEYLFDTLGIVQNKFSSTKSMLKLVRFTKVSQWGFDKIGTISPFSFNKTSAYSIYEKPMWGISLTRGKSPKYAENSSCLILNQKCNRWDKIDLSYTKKVDPIWLSQVNEEIFTQENDILINSTGEGTLGRASLIKSDKHAGLLYDSHILCLRGNSEYVNSQLLVYLINSSFGQIQVEILKGAQATKQTELGIDNMKKMLFPLPDIETQNQIANHITEIKDQIKALRQKAESLRKLAKKEFEEAVFSETKIFMD